MNSNESTAIVVTKEDSFTHALEPSNLESAYKLASLVAKIGIGGVKSAEDALIRIMHGRTLGISAAQALQFVYVVNNRAGLDATLMRGLCMAHPECEEFVCTETTATRATFRAKRKGQAATTLSWTLEQAVQAKLVEKDNWRAYPAAMLRARATADLARLVFPDAVAGLPSREELEDTDPTPRAPNELQGEVIAQAPARDYDAEAAALKAEIDQATTKEARAAVRKKLESSDLPEAWRKDVVAHYNAAGKAKGAAASSEVQP